MDVNNISKSIGSLKILDSISFKLYKGDKVGLIGKNGVGKSTLCKIIIGETSKDNGNISLLGKVGYLPQSIKTREDIKAEDFIGKIYDYNYLMDLLTKLNLKDLMKQNISTLSGGERTKLCFAKTMAEKPDVLLLDEPTNQLDWESMSVIEDYINKFNGAVLIISHDRFFLDRTVSQIYELENMKVNLYRGNYSFYASQKRIEKEKVLLEYEEYMKKKRALEEAARKQMERSNKYNNISVNDFQRHKASKIAKRSKAIISRLENMEEKEKPFKPKEVNIKLDQRIEKTSNVLIRATNISKSFDRLIFKDISFTIEKESRIALLGRNGSGKSTLLKTIMGKETFQGDLSISPSLKIGYLSQGLENLEADSTVIDEMKKVHSDETYIRTILGAMLFRNDDVYKNIEILSFGEKVRVAFSKLIIEDNCLLILDEPTNFLDIPTSEAIEEALLSYKGAILFVSHDRFLVKKLAKEIWELESKKLIKYLSGYDYYLRKKDETESSAEKNVKEEILALEMRLSHISFKLLSCSETDKKILESEYFKIAEKLRNLK